MGRNSIPPYRDKNPEDRPGEEWVDIPGLDGLYLVSNYGRVLRKNRTIYDSLNRPRTFPQQIILAHVNKDRNMHMNDWSKRLQVTVHVDKFVYHFQINRLVYYCFVTTFDINNKNHVVQAKNGNGLDVFPDNLELVSYETKNQRSYNSGRQLSIFQVDKIKLIEANLASKAATSIVVSRYDAKGVIVDTFESITAASEYVGISCSGILHACKNISRKAAGYYWRRGNASKINWKEVDELLHRTKKSFQEKRGTKITQFDLKGTPIAVFATKSEAARKVGVSHRYISMNIQGKAKSAGGYTWREGDYLHHIEDL